MSPYHLLNLYVRANLAESMAFVWLPLCLWTAREAVLASRRAPPPGGGTSWTWGLLEVGPWVIGLAVSYAGLMYTSNLVVVLFTPLLAGVCAGVDDCLCAAGGRGRHTASDGGSASAGGCGAAWRRRWGGIAGLGLSAAFWLPMLLERNYVRVDQWFGGRYDFRGHFVYLFQLFSPNWGFGVSVPGPLDPISFQIGAVALIFATIGVLMLWRRTGLVAGHASGVQGLWLGGCLFCGGRHPGHPAGPADCRRAVGDARDRGTACSRPSFPGAGWC